MNIRFYKTFSKRRNSTKQVGTATYSTHTCTLKQPTSMHDPVVQLATSEMLYTYAYIPDWSSYYFVQDVVSLHNGLVEYHLIEDVLATYKSTIGGTTARILFSSSTYNKNYADPRIYVDTYNGKQSYRDVDQLYAVLNSVGTYLLTVYNDDYTLDSTGFSVTYELNEAAFKRVRQWFGDSSIFAALRSYFNGSPLESIFSCIWVPYTIGSSYKTVQTDIKIGNRSNHTDGFPFLTGETCYAIKGFPTLTRTFKFNRPVAPTSFEYYEPYCTAQIYLPGVGPVDLSLKDWGTATNLYVDVDYELVTGNITYNIYTNASVPHDYLQQVSCNVAAMCPIAQVTTNGGGVLTSITGTVGAAVGLMASSGAGTAIAAAGLAMSAGSIALNASKRGTSIVGSNGGRGSAVHPHISITEFYANIENTDNPNYIAQRGRTCGQTLTISTLSGFVQCEGASVSGSMTEHEREEINDYLNSGFYYE